MLCEPGFNSMGFYSLWEGGLQAGWGCIWTGAEGRQKGCLPEVVAAAIVPPLKGANVDSKKEWLCWNLAGGKGGAGVVAVLHTLEGVLLKWPKMAQTALCCHLNRDWARLLFVDGLVTPPLLPLPAPPHHWGKPGWERGGQPGAVIPQLPAFLCPALDFALRSKQECPASHSPCRYREGGDAGKGEQGGSTRLRCCKERQALLPAALPVLQDHAHLLFFHLFTWMLMESDIMTSAKKKKWYLKQ